MSGCINHPGVEAVARCRQCGKPVCGSCLINGPTGKFCSEGCRAKHETFVERAHKMELKESKAHGFFSKLVRLLFKLIMLVVAILALGLVVTKVFHIHIPFLSDVVLRLLALAGVGG